MHKYPFTCISDEVLNVQLINVNFSFQFTYFSILGIILQLLNIITFIILAPFLPFLYLFFHPIFYIDLFGKLIY